jgi:hypothetical protein
MSCATIDVLLAQMDVSSGQAIVFVCPTVWCVVLLRRQSYLPCVNHRFICLK